MTVDIQAATTNIVLLLDIDSSYNYLAPITIPHFPQILQ